MSGVVFVSTAGMSHQTISGEDAYRCNKLHLALSAYFVYIVQIFLIVMLVCYLPAISKRVLKLPVLSGGGFNKDNSGHSNDDRFQQQWQDISQRRYTKIVDDDLPVGQETSSTKSTKNKFRYIRKVMADTKKELHSISSTKYSNNFVPLKEQVLVDDEDWNNGSFCHNFLAKTFQTPISVCANERTSAVHCFGSPFSQGIGTCILENVLVNPGHLAKAMENANKPAFNQYMPSLAPLSDKGFGCHDISITQLLKHFEMKDYVLRMIDHMKYVNPLTAKICDQWIEEDVFFFTANKVHIYFRFLAYFNLHKMLTDFHSMKFQVIRISGSSGYKFADFDKKLFSEVNFRTLDELGNGSICFKKVILVPRSYASFLFKCKMNPVLRTRCYNCKGKGLSKTQVLTFRDRVLKACSLEDRVMSSGNFSVIFVSRRPYIRFKNDNAKHFSRVMDNEDSLMKHLHDTLKSCTIQRVNLENLDICEQVRLAHDADIYLGVHGAGLVHLWWLRDHAVIYELEPSYQRSNPTFWMLAHLSQRKYVKSSIAGGTRIVHANVKDIVSKVQQMVDERKGSV